MDKKDRRRRAGRSAAAVKKRIAELEAASAAQEAAPEAKKTQPKKIHFIDSKKTAVIPFPVKQHVGNASGRGHPEDGSRPPGFAVTHC